MKHETLRSSFTRRRRPWFAVAIVAAISCSASTHAGPAAGPLKIHPANPRYFTDGTKANDGTLKAVYLTGSHTWNNLVDMRRDRSEAGFDFPKYLDFLERYGHNFIRMWAWDSGVWDTRANGDLGKDKVHEVEPLPWARTGPGNARDGRPRFDLAKFDPDYFERLRERVSGAGRRGIYVSVMFFEGWGLMHGDRGRAAPEGWAWGSHPFHPDNNVHRIDGSAKSPEAGGAAHRLGNKAINDIQAAYIRKVADTVNDLDNVLFEVINEGGEKNWDWWVLETVREHERSKPTQHPIGLTGHGAENSSSLLASPADWVSPGRSDGFAEDPPAWNEKKVSLLDTDHIWGVGGNASWVWKAFLRGHNPIFMDPYDGSVLGTPNDKRWEPVRRAMGNTRRLAGRLGLAALTPQPKLSSTGYCLANPGIEYVAYQPASGKEFSVEASAGTYRFEWWPAGAAERSGDGRITISGPGQKFKPPIEGEAILHLKSE